SRRTRARLDPCLGRHLAQLNGAFGRLLGEPPPAVSVGSLVTQSKPPVEVSWRGGHGYPTRGAGLTPHPAGAPASVARRSAAAHSALTPLRPCGAAQLARCCRATWRWSWGRPHRAPA